MKTLIYSTFFLALAICIGCDKVDNKVDLSVADTSKPLIFLTHPTHPPCSYINEKGECVGTDIDLARKIAKRMKREMVLEAVRFEELLPRLKSGTADYAIATITITEARKLDVDFSKPYSISGNSFLYRAEDKPPRMSQLMTKRVAVESGTTGDIYLCLHGADPVRYPHMSDAIIALESGEVDAIFFDNIPLTSWANDSNGKLKVSPLETREGYGVAINKRRHDILKVANEIILEEAKK